MDDAVKFMSIDPMPLPGLSRDTTYWAEFTCAVTVPSEMDPGALTLAGFTLVRWTDAPIPAGPDGHRTVFVTFRRDS